MDKVKRTLYLLFGFVLCTLFVSAAVAQDVAVLVTPEEAQIDLGESVKFEAFAFTLNGNRTPVRIDEITWSVSSDLLGTITQDGFFIAGRQVGVVEIKVRIVVGSRTFFKVAVVVIGRLPKPFFDVEVVPSLAVVPNGSEQQFEVVVRNPRGTRVVPKHVGWEVAPETLGKISDDGLFVAGADVGHGRVIAIVDIDGLTLRASAKVVVSPPATGVITGNIAADRDGAPIKGAKVKAIRLGRIHWVQKTRTGADGNYVLEKLIPGFYVVYANARGFIGEFYNDTRNYLEATPVNVSGDVPVNGIDFGLSEGGAITGNVVSEDDAGLPLANVHVVAFLAVKPRFAKHVLTDANGDYAIESLPTGSYFVRANTPGYRGEYYDNARDISNATLVNVVEPETVAGKDFALARASAISGVVTNVAGGDPIAGAHIRVFQGSALTARLRPFKETRTDENGKYIVQVPPGSYFVAATAPGFNGEFYDNAREISQATLVEVFENLHTTGIDFDLVPRSTISGTVIDQVTSLPIAGAVVEAFREHSLLDRASTVAGFRGKTDSNGNYLIENVPAGKYIVVAAAETYLREFWEESPNKEGTTLVTVPDNTDIGEINFTLEKGGSISGLVVSETDNTPIAGALIRVFGENARRFKRTRTHDDGTYRVEGLPTGKYVVQVISKGFFSEFYNDVRRRSEATPVDVNALEETSAIDFSLAKKLRRRGTIAGRVFADEDESSIEPSIEGALVVAIRLHNRMVYFTFSGEHGLYELSDLPAGKYFMFAVARGFIGEFYDDAHLFRDADPVLVEAESVTDGINFGLKPRESSGIYAISGTVRSLTSNAPIEGILVQARFGDEIEVNAVTDENGNYLIEDVPAGEFKIEATGVGFADGYFGGSSSQNAAAVVVGNGQDAVNINLNLEIDNVTSVGDGELDAVPETFGLSQNYPNPFNPETTIKYQLSTSSEVTLKIFNLLGQEVITLVDKRQQAGVYAVNWDGKDKFGKGVASGIYIFRIEAGDAFKMSKRMLLLK